MRKGITSRRLVLLWRNSKPLANPFVTDEFSGFNHKPLKVLEKRVSVLLQFVGRFMQRNWPAQTLSYALQRPADNLVILVGDQPIMLDHARRNNPQPFRKAMLVFLQHPVDRVGILIKAGFGEQRPVGGQEMVIKDIDNNAATMTVLVTQSVAAAPRVCAVVGEGVYLTMKSDTLDNPGWEMVWNLTLDEIPHQTAEPVLGIRSGEIEMDEIIQALRILLCRISISNAIKALLASCWISTMASESSISGSST